MPKAENLPAQSANCRISKILPREFPVTQGDKPQADQAVGKPSANPQAKKDGAETFMAFKPIRDPSARPFGPKNGAGNHRTAQPKRNPEWVKQIRFMKSAMSEGDQAPCHSAARTRQLRHAVEGAKRNPCSVARQDGRHRQRHPCDYDRLAAQKPIQMHLTGQTRGKRPATLEMFNALCHAVVFAALGSPGSPGSLGSPGSAPSPAISPVFRRSVLRKHAKASSPRLQTCRIRPLDWQGHPRAWDSREFSARAARAIQGIPVEPNPSIPTRCHPRRRGRKGIFGDRV